MKINTKKILQKKNPQIKNNKEMKINTAANNTVNNSSIQNETIDTDFSVIEDKIKQEELFNNSYSDFKEIKNNTEDNKFNETTSIEVENIPEKETFNQKQKVDFLNNGFSTSFFGKKTEESKSEPVDDNIQTEIENDFLKSHFVKDKDTLSGDDFKDVADFLMETLDTGMSYVCAAIGKDLDKPEKYEISSSKKKKLSDQLARIFEKRQVKLTIEMLFAMSVVLIYSTPVREAFKSRSLKSEQETTKTDIVNESKSDNKSKGGRPKTAK